MESLQGIVSQGFILLPQKILYFTQESLKLSLNIDLGFALLFSALLLHVTDSILQRTAEKNANEVRALLSHATRLIVVYALGLVGCMQIPLLQRLPATTTTLACFAAGIITPPELSMKE